MQFPRSSGLLLHPTSLPGGHGIGDLGRAAYEFIDFLASSDQQFWQVLPLGPTGYGHSPYMCYSAMAGNPLLISLDGLVSQGWLTSEHLNHLNLPNSDRLDYDAVIGQKLPLLGIAAQSFSQKASQEQWQEFDQFCQDSAYWLNTYALFMALKDQHQGQAWYDWPPELSQRHSEALAIATSELKEQVFAYKFQQFIFFQQWSALKLYAHNKRIQIIGDIPIYVAHDSADVWAFPEFFQLDPETGAAAFMAGVPPDYFSETGQLWGNPIYNWDRLAEQDYSWWIERFRCLLRYVDIIRVDHFRGFQGYWQVPQGETTAINGEWVDGPGPHFFDVLEEKMGTLPILAEDLGDITPDVIALRDQFSFPGMKILQFAFGGGADNPFLPFNYVRNSVVYTGTHDNNTTVGWFGQLSEWERHRLSDYLGCFSSSGIHWDLIRLALSSIANQAIFPVQDVLGLGGEARMNFPSTTSGNWSWRLWPNELHQDVGNHLRYLTHLYGRQPIPPPEEPENPENHENHN